MGNSRTSYRIALFMLAVYAIAAVQFLASDVPWLTRIGKMSYADRLNALDKQYYKDEFYKYYLWLDALLPKDISFSILYNEKTDIGKYQRTTHKLNYYFYPRHVLFKGIEKDMARTLSFSPYVKNIKYPEVVYIMNTKVVDFRSRNAIKYVELNDKPYYLVARIDNKGLLIERSFIKNRVLNDRDWKNVPEAFKELYGTNMHKVVF